MNYNGTGWSVSWRDGLDGPIVVMGLRNRPKQSADKPSDSLTHPETGGHQLQNQLWKRQWKINPTIEAPIETRAKGKERTTIGKSRVPATRPVQRDKQAKSYIGSFFVRALVPDGRWGGASRLDLAVRGSERPAIIFAGFSCGDWLE